MKTLEKNLKRLLVGVLVGLPLVSFASGDISVVATEENSEMDKIKVEVPELFDLDVSIIDDKGRLIYSETLEKGSKSALVYNLSELEDGTYTFFSSAGHQEITKIVEVENKNINVIDKEVKNKPIFKVKDNLLQISFLNKEIDDVKISLNNQVSVFYNETVKDELAVNKAIDITNLRRGNYYVDLKVGDKLHNFSFYVF